MKIVKTMSEGTLEFILKLVFHICDAYCIWYLNRTKESFFRKDG